MSKAFTFANPVLPLWQASIAEVHRRRQSVRNRMTPQAAQAYSPPSPTIVEDLMAPAHTVAEAVGKSSSPPDLLKLPGAAASLPATKAQTAEICAELAAKFLWAEVSGNEQAAELYAGELKYSVCDVLGWAECVATYLAYKAQSKTLPYRPNMDVGFDLGTKSKIAIIGDWGTGDPVAINLLQEIKKLSPDVLLHLGDVYYACTQSEAHNNFLDVCKLVFGNNIPLYTLCGNHDMYSGGTGYYWLVDQIGQKSSYFCLQNPNWQFVALDTGHNDNDSGTVATNMTDLVSAGDWSEAEWALKKIQAAGARKTVLLSHHQLFSPFGSVGNVGNQPYAYNPNLFKTFQPVLNCIEWWFWGHEHTLGIYAPYMGLKRGRCVGASAVPVLINQQSYTTATGLQTLNNGPMPVWDANGILGNNGKEYDNCFAIMTLNGPNANVDYYTGPVCGHAKRLNVTDQI
jgi:hypothetical protein